MVLPLDEADAHRCLPGPHAHARQGLTLEAINLDNTVTVLSRLITSISIGTSRTFMETTIAPLLPAEQSAHHRHPRQHVGEQA